MAMVNVVTIAAYRRIYWLSYCELLVVSSAFQSVRPTSRMGLSLDCWTDTRLYAAESYPGCLGASLSPLSNGCMS